MDETKRKRGRPFKKNARRNNCNVKLTDEELDTLNRLCNMRGQSRRELFVEAIGLIEEQAMDRIRRITGNSSSTTIEDYSDYDYEFDDFDEYDA